MNDKKYERAADMVREMADKFNTFCKSHSHVSCVHTCPYRFCASKEECKMAYGIMHLTEEQFNELQ